MKEYKPSELFQIWVGYLEDEMGTLRYSNKYRRQLMHDLVNLFIKYDVDYSTAKIYKTNVLYQLVTATGRLDEGKYKGWKDMASDDYDLVLSELYSELTITSLETEAIELITLAHKDMVKTRQSGDAGFYNECAIELKLRQFLEKYEKGVRSGGF